MKKRTSNTSKQKDFAAQQGRGGGQAPQDTHVTAPDSDPTPAAGALHLPEGEEGLPPGVTPEIAEAIAAAGIDLDDVKKARFEEKRGIAVVTTFGHAIHEVPVPEE